jgi:hypothetical protein
MLKYAIASVGLALALCAFPITDVPAQDTGAGAKPQEAETVTEAEPQPEETEAAGEEDMTREDLLESLDQVHGKRARRLFKTAYWAAGLEGDMKAVYDAYGYPSTRYREVTAGVTLEKWTYLDDGTQFIFRDRKLTGTRDFNPGSALGIYIK